MLATFEEGKNGIISQKTLYRYPQGITIHFQKYNMGMACYNVYVNKEGMLHTQKQVEVLTWGKRKRSTLSLIKWNE